MGVPARIDGIAQSDGIEQKCVKVTESDKVKEPGPREPGIVLFYAAFRNPGPGILLFYAAFLLFLTVLARP